MNHARNFLAGIVLATGLVLNNAWAFEAPARHTDAGESSERRFCERRLDGDLFSRTELFFGLSRPDGSEITEEEFQAFVDAEVTPRFPDGLTLLTGSGQFRNSDGDIIQEGSKLLILLYPYSRQSSALVEQIRSAYKDEFQQESVLRVDEQSCVSF